MSGNGPEEGKAAARGGGARWTRLAVLAAACALVIGSYAWTADSGSLESWASGSQDSYYNLLVRGFRDGHLNVKREAPPGLAASGGDRDQAWLDAAASGVADMSYYKGKLYLYFGVTPALLLFWPYEALTGHYLPHRDAVVIFLSAGFLAGVGLLCAVWRRCFKETGVGAVAAGTLALGLANFAPVIVRRGDAYEVAVSCGYALTMLALAGVWGALQDERRAGRWLAAASLAYGLALGARPSLLFGAVILLVPVARAWREKRRVWPLLLAAAAPIVFIGLGLMAYNALRFDNPLEFGENFQLPPNTSQHFSLRYLWFNFRVGFLEPARWSGRFPFVDDITVPALPGRYYIVDHPFGVLTNIPLVWLALLTPLAWRRGSGEGRSILPWFLGAVALLFGLCALTLCLYDAMCLRYELEFASPLILLAVIGFLALQRALAGQPVWRRAAGCGWGLLLAFSVAMNLFAGVALRADLLCGLGFAFQQKGRADEAIILEQKAIKLKPGYAPACNNLGNALLQKGRVDEAITQYQTALQIEPGNTQARVNLGNALLQKGRVDDAIAQYQAALQINPNLPLPHSNLGNALMQKGRVDEAITHYQTALQIEPNSTQARNNLGRALIRKGDLDAATACFQKSAAINPNQADVWFYLGSLFLLKGDLDQAIASFRQTIKINPRLPDAYGNLGTALSQKGETKEAMGYWRQALEINPGQIQVLGSLAWALATSPDASLRDGPGAVALALQASQLSGGGDPDILRTLAAAYAEAGDSQTAEVTARRGLELAKAQKNDALAAMLQQEIKLYQAGAPVRDSTGDGSKTVRPGEAPQRGAPAP